MCLERHSPLRQTTKFDADRDFASCPSLGTLFAPLTETRKARCRSGRDIETVTPLWLAPVPTQSTPRDRNQPIAASAPRTGRGGCSQRIERMQGTYDPWLVGLSIGVAVIDSYVALDLASRVAAARGTKGARYWLVGGTFSMGTGIWSMQFIGMLAFRMPMPMDYDTGGTLLSLLIAVIASAFALQTVSRRDLGVRRLLSGGVCMGLGIAAMQYAGMEAMEMEPSIQYDPMLVVSSIAMAIAASLAALWIAFALRSEAAMGKKSVGALMMGAAIACMHYTAMAAANFAPDSHVVDDFTSIASGTSLAAAIGVFAFVLLLATLLASIVDARLADRSARIAEKMRKANLDLERRSGELSRANELLRQEAAERTQAERALLVAEERFRATFEQAAVGIAHISFDGQHLMANRRYCEMLGYAQDALLALRADTVTARDGPGALPSLRANLLEGAIDHYSGEKKFFRKDGSPIAVNRTISLARDARGEPLYYIRVIEDISERKAIEAARQRSEAEFGALFNQAAVGMAETTLRGVFLRVNEKLCTMLGYTPDELLGLKFQQITHTDDLTHNLELLRSFAAGERQECTYEKRYVCKDGSSLWVSVTMSRVSTGPESSPTAFAVVEDISERKRAEERLMYLAQFDALTGLPNRSLVRDRLALAIARAKRNDQMVGVMFLDLDNFSEVNDLLGHAAGDRVLQTAAALLSASLRDVDTLGRLGGDEFTIVLENITGEDQVSTVAEKIKQVFAEPIVVDGREIFVSASVGIALYPHGGESVDALLQSADVAMYHAKGQGRNVHAFASPTMTAEASERFQMVALLRRGMERQEFKLHYQPIVNLGSRDIIGAEALIRLDSPEHGLISPAKFIPLAESTGLIVPIGAWVLKTACLEAKNWQVQGQPPVLVSVNLSARQLRTKGLVEMIAATLSETGLAPELLSLEITESQIMDEGPEVMATLEAIRRLGVGLAMDDFGTGFSSLGNLAKLPVEVLKIDRSFVARMLGDSDAMALVSTILTLARSLRLKVVAEGVETEQQEKNLRLL